MNADCFVINPLERAGWDSLLATHPGNCLFHGTAWARVLHETYGHQPLYFCQVSQGQLRGLLPVMEISSRLTGTRGVSLPFTDQCAPLFSDDSGEWAPHALAVQMGKTRRWRYLECRGGLKHWPSASPSLKFYGHVVDLRVGEQALYENLSSPIRRGIKRAVASGLRVEFSVEPEAMTHYYALHCLTRRRHHLPPQPINFFTSIAQHVIACGAGAIATVYLQKQPIAGAVLLHQNREGIYKFGASDYAFQGIRPNNLLLWEAIKWYAAKGFATFDMGRTSLDNTGLRHFKQGFGAQERPIEYSKYDLRKQAFVSSIDGATTPARRVFRWLSLPMLRLAGRFLYPHIG